MKNSIIAACILAVLIGGVLTLAVIQKEPMVGSGDEVFGTSITTINATDRLTDSRTTINDNFAALNAGKLEVSGGTMTGALTVPTLYASSTLIDDLAVPTLNATSSLIDYLTMANGTSTGSFYITNDLTVDGEVDFNGDFNFANATTTGTVEANEFYVTGSNISGSTYRTIYDVFNNTISSGFVSGGDITDNTDGTVDVAAGTGYIRGDTSEISQLYTFDWSASTSVDLLDDALNYVFIEYNGGSPRVNNTTDLSEIDHTSEFVIGLVHQESDHAHIATAGQRLNNFIHDVYYHSWEHDGIERASGLVTSEDASEDLALNVTAGVTYWALNRMPISALDTSTDGANDTFEYFYRDGGSGWTSSSTVHVLNHGQYDDGDGVLADLTALRYGVHWVYVTIDGYLYVQLGQGNYTLAQALAAAAPATMTELDNVGVLIAKIILQQGATDFYGVYLPWTSDIGATPASDHGDLSGLGDDDHPQYCALAQDETITGEWIFSDSVRMTNLNASTTLMTSATSTHTFYIGNDLFLYDTTNNGNPTLNMGSSATNDFVIQAMYNSGANTLDYVTFETTESAGGADKGEFRFLVDNVQKLTIDDGGLEVDGDITMTAATSTYLALTSLKSCNLDTDANGTLICGTDEGAGDSTQAWQWDAGNLGITPTTTGAGIYLTGSATSTGNFYLSSAANSWLYMDAQAESLMWNDSAAWFEFSDDLEINGVASTTLGFRVNDDFIVGSDGRATTTDALDIRDATGAHGLRILPSAGGTTTLQFY